MQCPSKESELNDILIHRLQFHCLAIRIQTPLIECRLAEGSRQLVLCAASFDMYPLLFVAMGLARTNVWLRLDA